MLQPSGASHAACIAVQLSIVRWCSAAILAHQPWCSLPPHAFVVRCQARDVVDAARLPVDLPEEATLVAGLV